MKSELKYKTLLQFKTTTKKKKKVETNNSKKII